MYGLSSSKVKLLTYAGTLARLADRPNIRFAKNCFFSSLPTFSNGQLKHLLREHLETQKTTYGKHGLCCTCSSGVGFKSTKGRWNIACYCDTAPGTEPRNKEHKTRQTHDTPHRLYNTPDTQVVLKVPLPR